MLQFVAALTVVAASTQQPSVDVALDAAPAWQGDYGQALETTRKNERPLLVVLDAPQDAQQAIDAELIAGESTANLLSQYNLCRVDATTPYGKKVMAAFGAKTLPHVAIIDKTGAVVLHKQSGVVSAGQWTAALTKHRSGERIARIAHSTNYRGGLATSAGVSMDGFNGGAVQAQPTVTSPGYCPSCQRQAMGY